jgi:AraC family ethanolamine operon transcriptional activator
MNIQDYTDFEEFRATIEQLDGRWLLNGGKDWHWRHTSLKVGACDIQIGYSHTGLITEGVSSNEGYSFYIPFEDHVWQQYGQKLDTSDIMFMEPGVEYNVTSRIADGWHALYVPKQLLEPHTTRAEGSGRSHLITEQQRRADAIRQLFYRAIAAVEKNPAVEFSPAAKIMEAELLSLLKPILAAVKSSPISRGRHKFSRQKIIEQSKELLEECDDEPLHVSELAELIGVSERTLRTAFNEHYQISPHEYLQVRQLHAIHRDLLFSDPGEKTVTDILLRRGVWEFGRFSGRYKRHFGKLPSETLRQPPLRSEK